MFENESDGLLKYYGINNVSCKSIENYETEFEHDILLAQAEFASRNETILLAISIKAEKISERNLSFSVLLQKKLNLKCEALFDHCNASLSSTMRTGVVQISNTDLPFALRLLHERPYHSFIVFAPKSKSLELAQSLMQLFCNGILVPNVLSQCCKTALSQNSSFLHILRGNDGYSINHISNKTGSVLGLDPNISF